MRPEEAVVIAVAYIRRHGIRCGPVESVRDMNEFADQVVTECDDPFFKKQAEKYKNKFAVMFDDPPEIVKDPGGVLIYVDAIARKVVPVPHTRL